MSKTKLNTLLAKTDHLASSFKKGISEYIIFFKNNQSSFKGEKRTYTPKDGTIDIPSKRSNVVITTTVDEKLQYLVESSKDYINALFSQEKTNASGVAKATLIVDEINFGEYTSLELLRLKNILENGDFENLYKTIPVRSDSEIWNESKNEMYVSRKGIFETEQVKGVEKSTTKEQYILPDPNVTKDNGAKYTPQVASKDTIIELGDYTHQRFTGEYTHRQRAEILQRRTKLLTAVVEALKVSNDVEALESDLTANKLFGYLHNGKI